MSSSIFPLSRLPLASRTLRRVPSRPVPVQRAENGKGYPIRRQLSPRRRWAVDFGPMSEAAGEVQELARFAGIHGGRYDTFLLRDPLDYQVTDQGFGVGDGTTTVFQLQRALGGAVSDVLGTWPLQTKRRRNKTTWLANWTASGAGAGAGKATLTANAGVAPDGTMTAYRAWLDRGATPGVIGDNSYVTAAAGAITLYDGLSYTASIWMRSADGVNHNVALRIGPNVVACLVTPTWQRFSSTYTYSSANADSSAIGVWCRGAGWGSTDQSADLLVWGPQVDVGATVATPQMSADAAATFYDTPAYWPALGGGFEPVAEPGPDLALTIEGDGLGVRPLAPYQRTNLIAYSEQADVANWNKTNVTVAANNLAAPDGASTADTVTDNATSGGHYLSSPLGATVVGQLFTASAYFKAGTYTGTAWIGMGGGIAQAIDFNLLTGGVSRIGSSVVGYSVQPVGGGWWRASVTVAGFGTASAVYIGMGSGSGSYAGTGQTIGVWGAQLELGAFAGDYIPTTTAAASRTDYALGANGQVTLGTPARSGAQLAWSGSFYRRVRFASDDLDLERIASGLWRSGRIELEEEPA